MLLPLKATVDRDRRPGRFILTGSADLLDVKQAGDSLAGRAETIELFPLSQGELERREQPEDFVTWLLSGSAAGESEALDATAVLRGGYPEPVQRDYRRAHRWFRSYVERLSGHDARELSQGGYSGHLHALLTLVAAGSQQELVRARVARELGVTENTADSYLRLTHTMRLIHALPPWARNPRGRVVRRPKVGLIDAALSAQLTGFTAAQAASVGGREYWGLLVEQFVGLELAKQRGWSATDFTLHHYRDHDGLELDLLLELADGRLIAIKIKSSTTVTERSWRNVAAFRDRLRDRQVIGVCFHGGTQRALLHGWLHILPISVLWRHDCPH